MYIPLTNLKENVEFEPQDTFMSTHLAFTMIKGFGIAFIIRKEDY